MKWYVSVFWEDSKTYNDSENEVILKTNTTNSETFIFQECEEIQDTREILDLKALIRRGEAKAACRYIGLAIEEYSFSESSVLRNRICKKIANEVRQMLTLWKRCSKNWNHIRFMWQVTLPIRTEPIKFVWRHPAIDEMIDEACMKDCRVWMYRGAWKEWEIDHIEMAVPISPEELRNKRNAINGKRTLHGERRKTFSAAFRRPQQSHCRIVFPIRTGLVRNRSIVQYIPV